MLLLKCSYNQKQLCLLSDASATACKGSTHLVLSPVLTGESSMRKRNTAACGEEGGGGTPVNINDLMKERVANTKSAANTCVLLAHFAAAQPRCSKCLHLALHSLRQQHSRIVNAYRNFLHTKTRAAVMTAEMQRFKSAPVLL